MRNGGVPVAKKRDVWDIDLPQIKFNKESTKQQAQKYRMGNVKLALGRGLTREEFEKDRKRILELRLP